jgi:MoaA/NifB/PqqE/SkfB family radical SAM enzyme
MQYFEQTGMKYWDDFNRRANETVESLKAGKLPPLRRLSLHITQRCNMACRYCNEKLKAATLPKELAFKTALEYSEMGGGILHLTGGEPTLVPYLKEFAEYVHSLGNVNLHLNSNMYDITGLEDCICGLKRLKVSFDTSNRDEFNRLIGGKLDAFDRVTKNLDFVHDAIAHDHSNTVVSLTCTVSKQNYKDIPTLLQYYYQRWPKFYAVFFSSYKGINEEFVLDAGDINELFWYTVPDINRITEQHHDDETRLLFQYSHDSSTFSEEVRFEQNADVPCYIQLSELTIDSSGTLYNCSHLFRDGRSANTGLNIANGHLKDLVAQAKAGIHRYPLSHHCLYGCNKKLVTFNEKVYDAVKCSGR